MNSLERKYKIGYCKEDRCLAQTEQPKQAQGKMNTMMN